MARSLTSRARSGMAAPELTLAVALAALVGTAAIVAVLVGAPRLTSIIPTRVPVAGNTGVCFVLFAAAIWVARPGSVRWRAAAPILAAPVMLIAGLTIAQVVSGIDLGLDGWLLPAPAGASIMSPQTAAAFLFLSVALLLNLRPVMPGLARAMSTVVLFIAFINVVDAIFGAERPTLLGGSTQMALPTALVFLALALAVQALVPRGSLSELVRLPGPAGTLSRRMVIAAIAIPIVVGWLRLAGERAGWYDTSYGVAITTTATIVLFLVAIRLTARTVGLAEEARREAELALEGALAESTDLYDYAPIGYHSLDRDGRYVRINRTELAMLGQDAEEVLGTFFRDRLTPAGRQQFAETFPQFMESGMVRDLEYELLREDGSVLPVRVSATAIRDADGQFVASRSTVQDISEQRALEHERTRALAEAVAANRAKGEFLSRMSHELRTPLNSVLGFAQLLESEELTPDQAESVSYIRRAGRHLLDLINEVLDLARVEQGSLGISLEPVALSECLDEVASFIRPLAASRKITLDLGDLSASVSYVMADRQRLRQVLLNLLSNAVKYNRVGGHIAVSCEPYADGSRVRIIVSDSGRGIAPELQSRLFQPFDRLGAETTDIEGSGMGLVLSRALMQAMGGEIGATSTEGSGSQFWITLAAANAPVAEVLSASRAGEPSIDSGLRHTVLYIEDNPANLRLVERIVERMPHLRLLTAIQGEIGIELAREHQPGLVLLDLHLPDMTGSEVLERLRAGEATRSIPVVVLTADGSEPQERRLRAEGASDYLTKPINVSELIDMLERHLTVGAPGTHG